MSTTGENQAFPGPHSQDDINLAWADTFISFAFFFVTAWIAWKHGKPGMATWPAFNSCFIARLIAAIYQLATRDAPAVPTVVSGITSASILATVSLTIVGVLYECNTILPMPPKRKQEKYTLGFLHINNTIGVSIAMFGGTPSATGGVMSPALNKAGNWLMLLTLFFAYAWMPSTYKKIQRFMGKHPNAQPAQYMFWAVFAAAPFWVIRLVYGTVYAFAYDPLTLDPILGNFETKLVLVFGTWLFASIPLTAGGWLGMKKVPRDQGDTQVLFADPETALRVERRRTHDELRREYERQGVPMPVLAGMVTNVADAGQEETKFQILRKMVSQTFSVRSRL